MNSLLTLGLGDVLPYLSALYRPDRIAGDAIIFTDHSVLPSISADCPHPVRVELGEVMIYTVARSAPALRGHVGHVGIVVTKEQMLVVHALRCVATVKDLAIVVYGAVGEHVCNPMG